MKLIPTRITKDWPAFWRQLRRIRLVVFDPFYVMVQLSTRKGSCKSCGCCKVQKCKYEKDNRCTIYHKRPFFCKIYPIDEKDKTPFGKKNCGFYWSKQSKAEKEIEDLLKPKKKPSKVRESINGFLSGFILMSVLFMIWWVLK